MKPRVRSVEKQESSPKSKGMGEREVFVPEVVDGGSYADLLTAIGELHDKSRARIASTANLETVRTYWNTGRYIVEYEQHGSDRAKYGEGLIDRLARDLTLRRGRGFSKTNVLYMRKFYLTFRKGETLSHFLSWSHYMLILKSADGLEIEFYCKECERSKWSVRELRRQLDSMLFHRLALSKDRKGVLELARKGNEVQKPEDLLRDHYVLEFSGIERGARYTEPTLHAAIVERMKNFMLELGKGFAFVRSQYRVPVNTVNPCRVDLVFYNYFLKCFVLIDLKRSKVEHYDIGQMNMYLNYFKAEEGSPSDNPPIGIVLGADKDDLVVEYATQGITNKIFVSRYQLYLPDKDQLRRELAIVLDEESKRLSGNKRKRVAIGTRTKGTSRK